MLDIIEASLLFVAFTGVFYLILENLYTPAVKLYSTLQENAPASFAWGKLLILIILFLLTGFFFSWYIAPVFFFYPLFESYIENYRRASELKKMEAQLIDFLNFYATSVRAGSSLLQGFEASLNATTSPLYSLLLPVLEEVKLGKKLGEAIIKWAKSIDSREGYLVGTTISIFQETGGNLTEVLMRISELLKKRVALRNKIESLTAMGKLQAIIMIFLAPGVILAMAAMAPDLMGLMFRNIISIFLVIVAIVLEVVAILIMRRMVKIDY